MKTTAKQIGMILLVSGILVVAGNLVHPRRIPWIQDWSRQVESRAMEMDIRLVSLPVVLELFRSGTGVFIDARSRSEFIKGHLPGAVSIPFEQLDDSFGHLAELLDGGDALVVYCGSRLCDDALLLAREIRDMGGDAALFADGYESWIKHGGKVEQ